MHISIEMGPAETQRPGFKVTSYHYSVTMRVSTRSSFSRFYQACRPVNLNRNALRLLVGSLRSHQIKSRDGIGRIRTMAMFEANQR